MFNLLNEKQFCIGLSIIRILQNLLKSYKKAPYAIVVVNRNSIFDETTSFKKRTMITFKENSCDIYNEPSSNLPQKPNCKGNCEFYDICINKLGIWI